jgi:hypothetical protein
MGRSGWKKRVANSQTTAGSFQGHEKTTTVDCIGVRLNFPQATWKDLHEAFNLHRHSTEVIFDDAVKPYHRATTMVNTGNVILLRTATRPSEEDPK